MIFFLLIAALPPRNHTNQHEESGSPLITPKAFANLSPGLPQPWDQLASKPTTPKVLAKSDCQLFQSYFNSRTSYPGLKQPWAEIDERLRRN